MTRKIFYFIFGKTSQRGFTLIELMVTMVIFVFVIAAVSNVFTGLLTQFKQQSRISETNIEKTIGLEILRQDLETAGYGLPWTVTGGWAALANYNEASPTAGGGVLGPPDRSLFNDGTPVIAPIVIGAPRAIVSSENNGFRGSDYLVIKSAIVAENNASQLWTWVFTGGATRAWNAGAPASNLAAGDFVIALDASATENFKTLVTTGGAFSVQFSNVGNLAPSEPGKSNIVYGIRPSNAPGMPFNRADYYIANPLNLPLRCATSDLGLSDRRTGVLMKGIVTNTTGGGNINTFQPLIDCVADMQVAYGLDINDDGTVGTYSNPNASAFSSTEGATAAAIQATLANAALVRQRLKEVRIYVLAHEGQIDFSYNFVTPAVVPAIPANSIRVGEVISGTNVGRDYLLSAIPNWQNYRWKVYTLVVKPKNLGVQ